METQADHEPDDHSPQSGPGVTIDYASSPPASDADNFAPKRRVLEGSRPRLSAETQALLRTRLRAVTILFLVSFGLFFGRWFLLAYADRVVVAFHAFILIVLGAGWALLSSRRPLSLGPLRRRIGHLRAGHRVLLDDAVPSPARARAGR